MRVQGVYFVEGGLPWGGGGGRCLGQGQEQKIIDATIINRGHVVEGQGANLFSLRLDAEAEETNVEGGGS